MARLIECEQGSPEWHAAKCGIPSASNFDKIITTDGKPSKQRTKYLYQLAGERVIGKAEDSYANANMQRGQEMEAEAREAYSLISGNEAQKTSFWLADGYGASPDGIIGEDGLLELKNPILTTHVGYLLDDKLPTEYFCQTQGQLLVTGRAWLDFMSYYPGLRPLLIRVVPDKAFQKALKIELEIFVKELAELAERIRQ